MSPRLSRRPKAADSSVILPDSIFERSRMSLSSVSRALEDCLTVSRYSRCSSLRSVSSAMSVIPITAFIGVRISWLMLARNSDFNRAASRARSRASASTSSARLRALMSSIVMTWPVTVSPSETSCLERADIHRVSPPGVRMRNSMALSRSSPAATDQSWITASRSSGWIAFFHPSPSASCGDMPAISAQRALT